MEKAKEIRRQLDGVWYKIFIDVKDVELYVSSVTKKEWTEDDFKVYGKDLHQVLWKTEEIEVKNILPNWEKLKTEEFKKDLAHRIKRQEEIQAKNIAIPPLILRGADLFIFDGYARWSVFSKKGIKRCIAYVAYSDLTK